MFFGVRLSSLGRILKKFLKFEKSSLDDSYKKDSYKENSVYKNPVTLYMVCASPTHGLQSNKPEISEIRSVDAEITLMTNARMYVHSWTKIASMILRKSVFEP